MSLLSGAAGDAVAVMDAMPTMVQTRPYSATAVAVPALERWIERAAAAAAVGTLVLSSVLIASLLAFVIIETRDHVGQRRKYTFRPIEGLGTTGPKHTRDLP